MLEDLELMMLKAERWLSFVERPHMWQYRVTIRECLHLITFYDILLYIENKY